MHDHSRYQAVARSGVCRKKCRRHEMFIDEKCSWFSRSSELSEMLGISLNSEESKMGVRASYKHFAATRLFFPKAAKWAKDHMQCCGKRSATPLWITCSIGQTIQSAIDASLCRRTPHCPLWSRL